MRLPSSIYPSSSPYCSEPRCPQLCALHESLCPVFIRMSSALVSAPAAPLYTLPWSEVHLCLFCPRRESSVRRHTYTKSLGSCLQPLGPASCDRDSSTASARSSWVRVIVPKPLCRAPCQAGWAWAVSAEAEALSMSGFFQHPRPEVLIYRAQTPSSTSFAT